jgi:hypothetical protein
MLCKGSGESEMSTINRCNTHDSVWPVGSDSSENHCIRRPVGSDWSGGVGLACGMKRGIFGQRSAHAVRVKVSKYTMPEKRVSP